MVDRLRDRPALLRYYRIHAGLGQDTAAKAAGVGSPTTVHNWETGRTEGPNLRQLAALDERFGAGGALRDLYLALRTPDALTPAEHWWHNFQGKSGPCWGWIRIPGGQPGTAQVDAGPFRVDCEIPAKTGLFLQAHGFTPNPPVHVRVDGGGWVDFGHGILPRDIGAQVVNAVDIAVVGPRGELDNALIVASKLWLPHRRFPNDPGWFTTMTKEFGHQVERAKTALARAARAAVSSKTDVSSSPVSLEEVPRHWGGDRYRQLREARGLSLQDAAELASELDLALVPITKDHVYRLERGATPRVPQLVERLDSVLGADGRTCTAEVKEIHTTGGIAEIAFPPYWVGPIWVQFLRSGHSEKNNAALLWSPWRKDLALCDGVVVTTRRSEPSMPPLRVELRSGWRVRAGVGAHPRAVDVQEGWGLMPADGFAALARYFSVLEQVLRGARRD
jgi:transcriptional regulator with XRE-family HTH domain